MAFAKALLLVSCASALHFDEGSEKKPISKVVDLLTEMNKKLDAEQVADQEIYDKTTCWCKTNNEEKSASVQAASDSLQSLTSAKAEAEASSGRLEPEIRKLQQELAASKAALDKAFSIRTQQVKNFKEDEASLMESIKQVSEAAAALNSTGSALLQVKPASLAASIQKVVDRQSDRVARSLSASDRVTLDNFLSNPSSLLPAQPGFLQQSSDNSPADSSSGILGVLQAMADDFAGDLNKELDDEKANKKSYEELNAAKQSEISSIESRITSKTTQKAEADVAFANAKRDLESTQKTLAADTAFLEAVKKKCTAIDTEFLERQQTRAEETSSIGQALAVLTTDAARDLSFLQEASSQEELRKRASDTLMSAGKKLNAQPLITLAMSVKIDNFDKVKKAMDGMISDMKHQQADEVKEKDLCQSNINANELATDEKSNLQTTSEAKVASLTAEVKKAADKLERLKNDLAEMDKQMQLAGENRMKENKEYQALVAEQKEMQAVLKKAQTVLKSFYNAPSFVQVNTHGGVQQDDPEIALGAPEGFKAYEHSSGSSGVIELLGVIASDSAQLEKEAAAAEQETQSDYEVFSAKQAASSKATNAQILQISGEKAEFEADLAEAKISLTATEEELAQLKLTKVQLQGNCGFLFTNFELRQTAREEEMKSVAEAKAMLSGAKFEA
mmetsp:Transcript_23572/g.42580  ORF Transcript_23572/g.42580 Transcript_23572/m.42580 type:complete len:677 (-) Transcript_23572:80-2110(-)|eukprot:CAMPEP_0197652264 /NCGR_PEP_ID=MMETSP1338-20131121/34340_1 /TAXON_ID=43686 ORGANISM="Pelagodinium beii, Strain RCC1491" /NCGR_SAMPLE_ID=MMETSP1338 /ASSEMBLY_ACC=CAM_ASM_000754 /LENGTH=676 /DNA_ID=CAMNT_0043227097 /DNA_START=93 /DNA_END=2123 /DNA_ORIENTATION=-